MKFKNHQVAKLNSRENLPKHEGVLVVLDKKEHLGNKSLEHLIITLIAKICESISVDAWSWTCIYVCIHLITLINIDGSLCEM